MFSKWNLFWKIDGLETEVAALKTLVITSTPAMPNKHLHPHIDPKNGRGKGATSAPGKKTFLGHMFPTGA